jgi:hypothetical protein
MLSKANKLHATTTETLWVYIQIQVLPSPKGMGVEILVIGCAMDPVQDFPAWRCLWCRRGIGTLPNYDQWSCPNKPVRRGVSPHIA